jgi:hypothetical protein
VSVRSTAVLQAHVLFRACPDSQENERGINQYEHRHEYPISAERADNKERREYRNTLTHPASEERNKEAVYDIKRPLGAEDACANDIVPSYFQDSDKKFYRAAKITATARTMPTA